MIYKLMVSPHLEHKCTGLVTPFKKDIAELKNV